MYLKLPQPPSISHIVKEKDWGVNIHLEPRLVPFRRHFQPSVTVMKTNGLARFHRDRKSGLQPKITDLNSSNRGSVGVGYKRLARKKISDEYLLLTVSKDDTES